MFVKSAEHRKTPLDGTKNRARNLFKIRKLGSSCRKFNNFYNDDFY